MLAISVDKGDVIGFGAINMDKIISVDTIPKKDEEVFVTDLELHPGGSAANTIVGLAKLEMKAGIMGKVGNDEDGDLLMQDFRIEGVDTTAVIRAGARSRSGSAMVLVDKEGNRAIIVDPGVNDTIHYDEMDLDHISNFRLLHLTSFICKESEGSLEEQKRLVDSFEGEVSFDPGMVYARRGINGLRGLLSFTRIFMPNEAEVKILTGKDYRKGAAILLEEGPGIVVVKLGSRGCYITDGVQETEVPADPVKVVDTTGAGDAFNAGFIFGYLKDLELEKCGRLGNVVAGHCIQHKGARKGLPHLKDIDLNYGQTNLTD
ncbi:MAG: carbohydrate kinase family protein [Archaeoglobaceae archaeon]